MTREPPVEGPTDLALQRRAAAVNAPVPGTGPESRHRQRAAPRVGWGPLSVTRLSAVYLWAIFIALFSIVHAGPVPDVNHISSWYSARASSRACSRWRS